MMTGKDKSYRRAVLRSVIFLFPQNPDLPGTPNLTINKEQLAFQSGRSNYIMTEFNL